MINEQYNLSHALNEPSVVISWWKKKVDVVVGMHKMFLLNHFHFYILFAISLAVITLGMYLLNVLLGLIQSTNETHMCFLNFLVQLYIYFPFFITNYIYFNLFFHSTKEWFYHLLRIYRHILKVIRPESHCCSPEQYK